MERDAVTVDRRDAAAFAILLTLATVAYARVLELNPFSADDIRGLFWADGASAAAALVGDKAGLPAWRPLADFVGWLSYQSLQFDHLRGHYVVNVLLWTGCAWMIWRIVSELTGTFLPGLLAAATVLVDPRAIVTIIVLEHASSLACFFGLLAMLLVITPPGRSETRARWTAVALLLLASALSKEYGLAFTGALAIWSVLDRRRDAAVAAFTAGIAYTVLRIAFARGAPSPEMYCQEQGYFFITRTMCYDTFRTDVLSQSGYNVAATAIGSLIPGVFSAFGDIGIDPPTIAVALICLVTIAAGVAGVIADRAVRWLLALVPVCTACLSVMLYRDRNHVVAMCALGILSGLGVAFLRERTQQYGAGRRIASHGIAVLLMIVIASRAHWTRSFVADEVAGARGLDPCAALDGPWPLDRAFVSRIKSARGMPNPDCRPDR